MEQAIAYSSLAVTVSLAVFRPRGPLGWFRFSPGSAAMVGVLLLLGTGLLTGTDLLVAAELQWRPLVALAAIMVMTGVVTDTGAFERLAAWIEHRAHGRAPSYPFTLVFLVSVATACFLNNDAAIIVLTPLAVAVARRLYPNRPNMTLAFAFAVFLAPGVAPFVVSNPMNMIVAEYAHIPFNAYAAVMVPIAIAGAALTYAVLRVAYRHELRSPGEAVSECSRPAEIPRAHPAERPAVLLMLAVFGAYPIAATFGMDLWMVAVVGALGAISIARGYRLSGPRRLAGHVPADILVFLWGIFAVVQGLRGVGLVDWLTAVYHAVPVGSPEQIGVVGVTSAVGSALVDNHPMSIINMMALSSPGDTRSLLAALVGGDIGPRLLPIGSLAGLLWVDLLRRSKVHVSVATFVRLGTLVLVPTLTLSLAMLWLL